MPVNDALILGTESDSETKTLSGELINKKTNEKLPFEFKLVYEGGVNSEGKIKYILKSFVGNINFNEVKIGGKIEHSIGFSNNNILSILNTKVVVKSNNKTEVLNTKISTKDVVLNFLTETKGKDGVLKEELLTFHPQELLKLILKGESCVYYETKGKIIDASKEEKLTLEPAEDFSLFNPSIKGKIEGKLGDNELTGNVKINGNSIEVEKDFGDYLVKYTFK